MPPLRRADFLLTMQQPLRALGQRGGTDDTELERQLVDGLAASARVALTENRQ